MANQKRDAVQGLIDFVKATKPYHTKIFDIFVEYIHTDRVNVTITDKLKIDIGLGFNFHDYPCTLNLITGLNYNTYGYKIKEVDTINSKFILAGDKTTVFDLDHNTIGFQPGAVFDIYDSTGNDGRWIVSAVEHIVESDVYGNVTKDITEVTVTETIPSSIANGTIQLPILLPILNVVHVIDNFYVTNAFEIQGNWTQIFNTFYSFDVKYSTGNDATWVAHKSTYDPMTDKTRITLYFDPNAPTPVLDLTDDGSIVLSLNEIGFRNLSLVQDNPFTYNRCTDMSQTTIFVSIAESLRFFAAVENLFYTDHVAVHVNDNTNAEWGGGVERAVDVDYTTDTFSALTPLPWVSGSKVKLTSTGIIPTPLVNDGEYYVVRLNNYQFKLATNRLYAIAPSPVVINIADNGTGVLTAGTYTQFPWGGTETAWVPEFSFTVDAGTNILTTPTTQNWISGSSVELSSTGDLPFPLEKETRYYLKKISPTEFKLGYAYEHAMNDEIMPNIYTHGYAIAYFGSNITTPSEDTNAPKNVSAFQTINYGNTILTGGEATGLANNATVYTATITIDGTPLLVSVVGSSAQTFNALITQINLDVGAFGTAVITVNGNIEIQTISKLDTSIMSIVDVNLFVSCNIYGFISAAHVGTGGPYTAAISIDGVNRTVTTIGDNIQTYTALLHVINNVIDGYGEAIIEHGDIKILSNNIGTDSTVVITDTNLFSAFPRYVMMGDIQNGESLPNPAAAANLTIDIVDTGTGTHGIKEYVGDTWGDAIGWSSTSAVYRTTHATAGQTAFTLNDWFIGTRFVISDVNVGLGYFEVKGDILEDFPDLKPFKVVGSTGNNGAYTVSTQETYIGNEPTSFSATTTYTKIYVNEPIVSAVVDGQLTTDFLLSVSINEEMIYPNVGQYSGAYVVTEVDPWTFEINPPLSGGETILVAINKIQPFIHAKIGEGDNLDISTSENHIWNGATTYGNDLLHNGSFSSVLSDPSATIFSGMPIGTSITYFANAPITFNGVGGGTSIVANIGNEVTLTRVTQSVGNWSLSSAPWSLGNNLTLNSDMLVYSVPPTNLLTNSNFAGSASGWTLGGEFTYNTNSITYVENQTTSELTQNISVINGERYLISWKQTHALPNIGGIAAKIGSVVSGYQHFNNISSNQVSFELTANTTEVVPFSLFGRGIDGIIGDAVSIDDVTIIPLTQSSAASQTIMSVITRGEYLVSWDQTHSFPNNGTVTPFLGTAFGTSKTFNDTSTHSVSTIILANTTGSVLFSLQAESSLSTGTGIITIDNVKVRQIHTQSVGIYEGEVGTVPGVSHNTNASISESLQFHFDEIIMYGTPAAISQGYGYSPTEWGGDTVIAPRRTQGFQTVYFGNMVNSIGNTSTGLSNDATIYTASVSLNIPANIVTLSITGNKAQTFDELILEINKDLGSFARAIISNGNIVIISNVLGNDSKVVITDVNLFSSLTHFVILDTPVDGTMSMQAPSGIIKPVTTNVLRFFDSIGIVTAELADAAILGAGNGTLIGSWDYPYWDVGGFDENPTVMAHLYNSETPPS